MEKKLKKIIKVLLIIFLILLIIFVIKTFLTKQKLKDKGYSENQIQKFYDFSFDINVILEYDVCDNINEILNDDFNKDNLESYLKKCTEEEPIVETKDPFVAKLEQEKYYIPSNLERYMAYNDGVKTTTEIVTDVNCNIDREFYTNITKADTSKGNLILVNKYYYIDETYQPVDPTVLQLNKYTYWSNSVLSKEAHTAFTNMVDDAKELGYSLIDTSAYRTYEYQSYLYNKYLKENGLEWTLKSSAKPGHSEHHTGLATDIVKVGVSMYDFESTDEFNWIKDNAHKYGFILRYPEGKEYLTGYKYEPWHYRYVGKDVATYIYENDIVFEEYYAYFCEYKKSC